METELEKRRKRILRSATILGLILAAGACSEQRAATPAAAASEPAAAEPEGADQASIRFKDADDELICKLKPKETGFKVYDAADIVLGKITVADDRVKLKDADGNEQWKIKRKEDGGAEVEDANGTRVYRLKLDDGTWKVKSPSDETLFKLKPKTDGFEVRAADGSTLAKVKAGDDKLTFKTEEGTHLYTLKGISEAEAGMWFALEELSLAQRAALCVFFLQVG